MKKIVLALAISLWGYAASAQDTDRILDRYITVKDALTDGDSKAAAGAAAALRETIQAGPAFDGKEGLLSAVGKVAGTGDIEQQRLAFAAISAPLWKLVRQGSNPGREVYYQYCPMKKAYWLSYEKAIRNPYYGASMLTCGKVAETGK